MTSASVQLAIDAESAATIEIAAAVRDATRASMETISRLTAENDRLQLENARHRRNGMLRLMADLRKPETLIDVATLCMERQEVDRIIEGVSLPGWERPRDHIAEGERRGWTDEPPQS